MATADCVIGWDIGGAHVKACLLRGGQVSDVAQWHCPLWRQPDQLAHVMRAARQRWPGFDGARHAVTMTGEMADSFAHREEGVRRIASIVQALLPAHAGALRFFAGDAGWCAAADAAGQWRHIASANWLAAARHVASALPEGVLVDIGSTTTDLIAFGNGRVLSASRSDAERLASGELVYHGVVRTPLCALTQQIEWRGLAHQVMNEFFATTADIYRLCNELEPAHDQQPAADNGPKSLAATRQRLARMIGLDARDASAEEWLRLARAWRAAQLDAMAAQLRRVLRRYALSPGAVLVSAGCGAFLAPELARAASPGAPYRVVSYGARVASTAGDAAAATVAWAQVCAPCVAVAALLAREQP